MKKLPKIEKNNFSQNYRLPRWNSLSIKVILDEKVYLLVYKKKKTIFFLINMTVKQVERLNYTHNLLVF